MKKYFVIIAALIFAVPVIAQYQLQPPSGLWKIVLKNSGGKVPPPPEFILFKSNNTYLWGVDSLATEPKDGASTGTWFFTKEGLIVMVSGDSVLETRYYRPLSATQYKLDATQTVDKKEQTHMLEMDIFLEKYK